MFETLLYGWNGIGDEKLSCTWLLREKISVLRNKSFCGEGNYNNKRHKNIFNFVLFLKLGKIKSYFLVEFFCNKYRELGNFPIVHTSKWRSEYCRVPLLCGSGPKSIDKANSTVVDTEVCLGDSPFRTECLTLQVTEEYSVAQGPFTGVSPTQSLINTEVKAQPPCLKWEPPWSPAQLQNSPWGQLRLFLGDSLCLICFLPLPLPVGDLISWLNILLVSISVSACHGTQPATSVK